MDKLRETMNDKSDDWKPYVRALIYPIQFDPDPIQGIDRVLEFVVQRGALGASTARYLASVRKALASRSHLAKLIPQDHPEATIRQFLLELEHRLTAMVEPKK